MLMCCKMRVLVLLYLGLAAVESAKILGIFHVASYSHFAPAQTLMNALVDKGHDVSVIAVYKNKDSKFKLIHLEGFQEAMDENKSKMDLFNMNTGGWYNAINFFHFFTENLVRATFEHPNVKALLKSDQKFDMVIMEHFGNDAFQGFCHHYNASCILYSAIPTNAWINHRYANPENPAYTTGMNFHRSTPMDFLTRVQNTIVWMFERMFYQFVILPAQNSLAQEHIPNVPDLKDIIHKPDLIFLNSHESYSDPVPLTPNMIEIGGFHIKPPGKLPQDLQKFMDEAKEGVVLFSMGSVLKTKDIPEEKRNAFLRAFGKLKQRVLWKFDQDIPNVPANVKLLKWIPQREVLTHPNLKLFITHGGLFSTIEAIYAGVPVMGMPIFGDQEGNMIKCQQIGVGISYDFFTSTEETFYETIQTLLNNTKYGETAKKRSRLLQDRPIKPIDNFVYWINHVLKHGGEKHLKSAGLQLGFHQIMLLDVIAFLSLISLSVLFVFVIIVIKTCGRQKKCAKLSNDKKKR